MFKPEYIQGVGMVVLQILRVFTVITLAAMCASYWVFIVKVDKQRAYFVFECTSLFFTSLLPIVLIVSEFPLVRFVRRYFREAWPMLSDSYGLAWLGFSMVLLSCNMFGNLNKPANDADKLGPHFSKLVLASAILGFTFGVLNLVCSFVWSDAKEGINSRDIRANGTLANNRRQSLPDYSSTTRSNSFKELRDEKKRSKMLSGFFSKGKGTGEKTFNRPIISAPIQAHQDVERDAGRVDRGSPIAPNVQRPPTALHPANSRRSSEYSVADMNRF